MTQPTTFEPEGRAVPYIVEGEGPVSLVLVTGSGRNSEALGVISHYLSEEAGFHVIQIGARAGAAVDRAEAIRERVEDVIAVIDHLGLEDTWIGGHEIGGTVARVLASDHTDRINGLLLLGVEDEQIPLAPAIPVLIIQASDDQVNLPAVAEKLQASAPERASIKRIDGADHFFPATHPIETAVIIEEYLDWD